MLAKRSAGRLSNSRIACCTSDKSVTCQYCSFPCFTFVSVIDRKSTRLNSSHDQISYAVFCLKKKKKKDIIAAYENIPTQTPTSSKQRCQLHTPKLQPRNTCGPDGCILHTCADRRTTSTLARP